MRMGAPDALGCNMVSRWLAFLLVAVLVQVPLPTSGAPAAEPPFAPGTVWTYRYTVVPPSGPSRTGTLKFAYGGKITYRGRPYYYIEQTNTVLPGMVQRDYYVWIGGHFRAAAQEVNDSQSNVVEIIFDKTLPVDVPESVSGQAEIYQNGDHQADLPWSDTLSNRGTVSVTVPAGTFHATRWETAFQLGDLQVVQTNDAVGLVDIRVEGRQSTPGAGTARTYRELLSGPVPGR
jgi:hypothetical protein